MAFLNKNLKLVNQYVDAVCHLQGLLLRPKSSSSKSRLTSYKVYHIPDDDKLIDPICIYVEIRNTKLTSTESKDVMSDAPYVAYQYR